MQSVVVRARALAALLLLLLAGACGAKTGVAPECQGDSQCFDGLLCVGGSCIARAEAPGSWGVELEPRSDEAEAAFTDETVPGGGALTLTAGRKIPVTGLFVASASLAAPPAGHVVLAIAPAIPGRPDLQLETDVTVSSVDSVIPYFTVSAPEGVLGRSAKVTVTPSPPDDQVRAPLTFHTRLSSASVMLPLPARDLKVTGNLYSAIGLARKEFVARAFLVGTGQLVSNVSQTNDGGGFSLFIPASSELADAAQLITVELRPLDSSAPEPRLSSRAFPLGADPTLTLGNLYQPAFANPNVFRFNLRGGTTDGPPVGDAVIRARTILADDATGSADFLRDGRTGADGNADLSLLPGTANASRSYVVAAIPPAGSPYGALCVPAFALAGGGTAIAPAHLQVIALPSRPIITGTVVSADGAPVAGVSIAATPTAVDGTSACADAAGSPPAAAVTTDDGTFSLVLDPGTYRIDYDPPRGSPVPRLTENDVVVAESTLRAVQMARGGVVEGQAFRPDGSPLPSAGVRLYEVRCSGAADCVGPARREPALRAQTRTDANGRFRAVIPVP